MGFRLGFMNLCIESPHLFLLWSFISIPLHMSLIVKVVMTTNHSARINHRFVSRYALNSITSMTADKLNSICIVLWTSFISSQHKWNIRCCEQLPFLLSVIYIYNINAVSYNGYCNLICMCSQILLVWLLRYFNLRNEKLMREKL